jgi:hypothetical protein
VFLTLLVVTFTISVAVAAVIGWLFDKPVAEILRRIVSEELAAAWHRYVRFAVLVVGVSVGVRIWELEKYITPRDARESAVVLNADRWTLEVYRTVIATAQSIAWMLLVFFAVALIAFVVLRGLEMKHGAPAGGSAHPRS